MVGLGEVAMPKKQEKKNNLTESIISDLRFAKSQYEYARSCKIYAHQHSWQWAKAHSWARVKRQLLKEAAMKSLVAAKKDLTSLITALRKEVR